MRLQARPSRVSKRVRFLRAPGAGGVVGERPRRQRLPDVEDGVHHVPPVLHAVRPLEERRVAAHAVVEERLVAGAGRGPEVVRVVEVHLDLARPDHGPGDLGLEAEGDPLVGLHVEDEDVRGEVRDLRALRRAGAAAGGTRSRPRCAARAAACPCAGRTARRPSASCRCASLRATKVSVAESGVDVFLRPVGGHRRARGRRPRRTGRAPCGSAPPPGVRGWMARSTLPFSSRTASASKDDGGSIAVRARSWNRWFGTMSRSAPAWS